MENGEEREGKEEEGWEGGREGGMDGGSGGGREGESERGRGREKIPLDGMVGEGGPDESRAEGISHIEYMHRAQVAQRRHCRRLLRQTRQLVHIPLVRRPVPAPPSVSDSIL